MTPNGAWMRLAERAANARCTIIVARIERAIAEDSADARVEVNGGEIRLRGKAMVRRWISEPGLRFARRIGR